MELEKIQEIGCDGTLISTEVILETTLDRSLRRLVCQLYINELLLRHLFLHVDEVTVRIQTFSGAIGKSLASCHTSSVCNMKKLLMSFLWLMFKT